MTFLSAVEQAPWYVLRVKPRSEKKVRDQLQTLRQARNGRSGLDLEICVPIQQQRRTWSDRKKTVDVVLFKGYVFVSLPPKQRNSVFLIPNVIRYLQLGGQVATLSEKEISLIKRLAGLSAPIEIVYQGFRVGDEVEVQEGPLMGRRGRIVSANGKSKLQLEIAGLGCFAQVEVEGAEAKIISNIHPDV